MPSELALCKICGEPMPKGEEMFFYHGLSGPCPKPPLPEKPQISELEQVKLERDKWKSEYENLCKFANQYEAERDTLAARVKSLEEALVYIARLASSGPYIEQRFDNVCALAREALEKP